MRKIISASVAALLLTSCGGEGLSEQQAAEAHDVATDAAYDVVNNSAVVLQHEARITQLERRIAELEFRADHPEATR